MCVVYSVGVEDEDELLADLEHALTHASDADDESAHHQHHKSSRSGHCASIGEEDVFQ